MSENVIPGSPLDPFLVLFLTTIKDFEDGYQPGIESRQVATKLDVPPAFVDALFTSARTRGLVKPNYGRGNRMRWSVSHSGVNLVNRLNTLGGEQ